MGSSSSKSGPNNGTPAEGPRVARPLGEEDSDGSDEEDSAGADKVEQFLTKLYEAAGEEITAHALREACRNLNKTESSKSAVTRGFVKYLIDSCAEILKRNTAVLQEFLGVTVGIADAIIRSLDGVPYVNVAAKLYIIIWDTSKPMKESREAAQGMLKEMESWWDIYEPLCGDEQFKEHLANFAGAVLTALGEAAVYGKFSGLSELFNAPQLKERLDTCKAKVESARKKLDSSGIVEAVGAGKEIKGAVQQILVVLEKSGSAKAQLFNKLPQKNTSFLGRVKELQDLKLWFKMGEPCYVAISAMGGMGKTQLALKFAYEIRKEYDQVLWIDAGEDSLRDNYVALAEKLGEEVEKKVKEEGNVDQKVKIIKNALDDERQKRFLVFDGMDSEKDLWVYCPSGSAHVLITTRRKSLENTQPFNLVPLDPEDGLSLL